MTYNVIIDMAGNASLINRAAAAASQEGHTSPLDWAQTHSWELASQPGWADSWASAEASKTVNVNQDTGMRDDVISDAMILSAVQALFTAEGIGT